MIRRQIVLAVVALALAAAPSAFALAAWTPVVASGKVTRESRPVAAFTGIALSLPGKVEVVQGSPASVTVEADDNLLPEIETVVEDGKLRIRFRRDLNVSGKPTLRVNVTAQSIESLAVAGSGDVRYHGDPAVRKSVAGSGTVKRLGPAP